MPVKKSFSTKLSLNYMKKGRAQLYTKISIIPIPIIILGGKYKTIRNKNKNKKSPMCAEQAAARPLRRQPAASHRSSKQVQAMQQPCSNSLAAAHSQPASTAAAQTPPHSAAAAATSCVQPAAHSQQPRVQPRELRRKQQQPWQAMINPATVV